MDTWRFSRHHSGYDSLFPDNITWNLEDCLYLILSSASFIQVSDEFAFLSQKETEAIIPFAIVPKK
jgi:hypothetical protein